MITPAQCKAARLLLGWDFGQLSISASLYYLTVTSFESCSGKSHPKTRRNLRAAFESAGIVFDTENGSPTRRLKGYTDA